MRIVYIAAGAGGMMCGSCLRDNALAAALIRQGRDVLIVPAYTPLRTDEAPAPGPAEPRVVFGALNVFLQHSFGLFRATPAGIDRLFDSPALLRGISRFSSWTRPESVGRLALTVLSGEEGGARKEVVKLARWIAEMRPDIVNLPNAMFCGLAGEIRRHADAPVLCTLSGEDSFLEGLPEPYRAQCLDILRERGRDCHGFIATSRYYAARMAEFLLVPAERIHVAPLGINLEGHGRRGARRREPFTILCMARVCPQKGLRELAEAFILLKRTPEGRDARLIAAGYLDPKEKPYLRSVQKRIAEAGAADSFEYAGEVDRATKIALLQGASALCVPSPYPEAKGLYVIEALANGVPVVAPRRGALTELVEESGGGLLVDPAHETQALAEAFVKMIRSPEEADALGERGQAWAHSTRGAERMAEATYAIYEQYVGKSGQFVAPI
ncbi:MAG: glycosyltransferase family 4 protein [Candidatus Sumerlaeota bacterium]|nr:glycosyltransferase family 4 protein [Candidatus Sumerlaeota bacterium]